MRLLIAATLIALAACTTGPRDRTDLRPSADPSAVIATELAFAEANGIAGAITPVPGGVGPMTIAVLLRNTLVAAYRREGLELAKDAL